MSIALKTTVTLGLMAGALGLCAPAAATPRLDRTVKPLADTAAPKTDKAWCDAYGCHRRYYRPYYRHYGYYGGYPAPYYGGGYYRPYGYGYGPHVGIGIGGFGLGLY